jgi:hypothetical protein
MEMRDKINYNILEIVNKHQARFAYPTQTLVMDRINQEAPKKEL